MTRPVPRPAASRAGAPCHLCSCGLALAGEEAEQLADGGLLAGRPGQREVGLDLVAIAAAFSLLDHVAGLGEVGDDGAGAALGDAQGGCDVAQPYPRDAGGGQQDPGMVGQQRPVLPACKNSNTRIILLVS